MVLINKTIKWSFLAGLLALIGAGTLNYSGMCLSEGRWLSEEEKIDSAASYIIGKGPNLDYLKSNANPMALEKMAHPSYKGKSEFFAKNPQCCNLMGADDRRAMHPYSFIDRVTSQRADVVEVAYNAMFISESGVSTIIEGHTEYPQITNCGKIIHPSSYR